MNKKWIAWMLMGALTAGTLTGCGADDSAQTEQQASGEKTVVRVQMIGTFSMEDKIDNITGEPVAGLHVVEEDFESKHPDIDLEYVVMGWDDYVKKTQAMIMADQADVFQVPGIALMADQNVLEPLEPYIERDNFDLGVYLDGQVDGWRVQGPDDTEPSIYALPMLADTRFITYDKQIFDDWGVPYLSEHPTIEEITEAAAKMTGINPRTGEQNYGIMWRGSDTDDTVLNIAEGLGGTWGEGNRFSELTYHFNSDEMVQAAEILKSLQAYAPEGIMTNAGGENFGRENNDVAINLRTAPDAYMIIEELGLGDRYGTAYLFVNEQAGMGGMFAGSPIAIGVNSKVKDAAWEYIKYTSGEFFQNYVYTAERQLPCVKSGLEFEGIAGVPQMEMIMDSAQYLWTPRYLYRASNPRGILSAAVESIMSGSATAQDALNAAQADCEKWSQDQ